MKLTIGMASYNEYQGVYFTVQALRIYHSDIFKNGDAEILVIDNFGDDLLADWCKDWGAPQVRYERCTEITGTSYPRNKVFDLAKGEYVICVDSHVLLMPGALDRLWEGDDLVQGPMIANNLVSWYTHWDVDKKLGMFGPLVKDFPSEPFEIDAMGLGLFGCRKDSWLRFNESFRGFGGEEIYIHQKYRNAGRKVLCLPWMQWAHFFKAGKGKQLVQPTYPLKRNDMIRNLLIGWREVGLPVQRIYDHYGKNVVSRVSEEIEREKYNNLHAKGYPGGDPISPIKWAGIVPAEISVLDLGCGTSSSQRSKYKEYTGLDISENVDADIVSPLEKCAEYVHGKSFDLVTAFDVLEHLPPENIDTALSQIQKINTGEILLSICCRKSRIEYEGNPLHLTVMSRDAWIEKLSKYFDILDCSELNSQQTFYARLRGQTFTLPKVLLIGNGPSVTAQEMGGVIDAFDGDVARFNHFKTRGFEKYCGSRTDIWITCIDSFNAENEYKSRYFISGNDDDTDKAILEKLKAEKIPLSTFKKVQKEINHWPSSGAVATQYFLDQGYHVYLYGFDHFSKTKEGKHHYQDNETRCFHDADKEKIWFYEQKKNGRIKYLENVNGE